jgi:hypothetical protein
LRRFGDDRLGVRTGGGVVDLADVQDGVLACGERVADGVRMACALAFDHLADGSPGG